MLRVQQHVLTSVRATLTARGFLELAVPLVGPVTDPGVRGAKQADVDYYGATYKIMTSAILYKQAALLASDKIFSIAPNLRLEPPETAATGRHLVEFHQIDVEIADADRAEAMELAQSLVREAVTVVMREASAELELLGRDTGAFAELLAQPFGHMSHAEAVAGLQKLGVAQNATAEIAWEGERVLSGKATRPFFITGYPKGSRGFYDRESRSEPGVLRNFDLIASEGYGELASGAEREYEAGRIITRMRETGENPAKYGWYLDLVRESIRPSAGFGIGLERLVRYITGAAEVWQVCAFPKLPGQVA
ncbi:asparaginyl-tRNA synthetase [Nonomuraea thailandensis]|uniref:Asparaginyl-tRNA synthetase n=2 Tax=Nonomuraea thailandensis TaxID=1188745 RepID=A0A9X2G9D4_9ACTN|nr:asparaginyl-tRNA synthetase [Nonomuraea thailandensis]